MGTKKVWDFYIEKNYRYCIGALILCYALGRIIYCTLQHSTNNPVFLYEIISALIFSIFSILLIVFLKSALDGLFIGLLYILTSLVSRYIEYGYFGIIDFVWLTISGITLGGIILFYQFDVVNTGSLKRGRDDFYYNQLSNELQFLLNKTLSLLMTLGTILAAAMGILWAGEVWRFTDEIGKGNYLNTLHNAGSMAFMYLLIFFSIGVWIILPLYKNFNEVKNYYK